MPENFLPTPLPLPTLAPLSATATPTLSAKQTATTVPSSSPTITATLQMPRTVTATGELATTTPSPTQLSVILQPGSPVYGQNFAHPELGCDWLGVAGQVFGPDGSPRNGVVVVVNGNLAGQTVEALSYTGLARSYGEGGYEVELGSRAGEGLFWIELYDLQGQRLAEPFNFTTTADCQKNLVVINFLAARFE